MTEPKYKPISFTAPMVRAILHGRKTQTRMIVTVKNKNSCPYGQPGDRLWVKEPWQSSSYPNGEEIFYRADYLDLKVDAIRSHLDKWKSSIHMPRWASRITLEVTGVRVERLQDISEDDAIADGLKCITKDGGLYKYGIPDADGMPGKDDFGWPWIEWDASPVLAYKKLWEQIHGPGAWERNPWVWVIEFKRLEGK